jgi:hypothetical protein
LVAGGAARSARAGLRASRSHAALYIDFYQH